MRARLFGVARGAAGSTGLPFVAVLLLFTITSIFEQGFASPSHVSILLLEASFIGIVALGQFVVVVGGGIDLSVPNTLTASAVVLSRLANGSSEALLWAIPLVLLMAAAIGIVNGIGVAVLRGSPIVVTLAMNVLILGLLLALTGGGKSETAPAALATIADGKVLGIPGAVLVWVALALILSAIMRWSLFGRRVYALGANRTVALFSGVRPTGITVATYVVSALLAAVAGMLLAGHAGQPYLGMGDPFLFTSVAAVAIGGASILGGSGACVGTIAGALTLTILEALFPILNLSPAALNVIYAVTIIVTVTLSSRRSAGAR